MTEILLKRGVKSQIIHLYIPQFSDEGSLDEPSEMASLFGLPLDAINNLSDTSAHLAPNEVLKEKMVFVGGRYQGEYLHISHIPKRARTHGRTKQNKNK